MIHLLFLVTMFEGSERIEFKGRFESESKCSAASSQIFDDVIAADDTVSSLQCFQATEEVLT